MGISNEWQNISGLTYKNVTDTNTSHSASSNTIWTQSSAEAVATAMGWEVVHASDYGETMTVGSLTYDADEFYLIRPPADDEVEYNVGLFYCSPLYYTSGNYAYYGFVGVVLNTLTTISSIYASGSNAQWLMLRPTSQGCIAIQIGSYNVFFDKFYNPKSEVTKWGITNDQSIEGFIDIYTGAYNTSTTQTSYAGAFDFGGYVALKKYTVIDTELIYSAKTLYRAYIDYSNATKTVELGGTMYCGIKASTAPCFYIPLAD